MKYIVVAFLCLLSIAFHAHANDEVYYVIQPGDSLMTISYKHYGTHQKWMKIIEANPGIDPMRIEVGSKIRIVNPGHAVTQSSSEKINPVQVETVSINAENFDAKKVVKKSKQGNKTIKQTTTTVNNYYGMDKDRANKLKNYEKVEQAYLELKAKNSELRKKILELGSLKDENKKLKSKLLDAKSNYADEFTKQLQAYTDLTEVQSKILQEKHRILNQRLWLSKNDNIDKCNLEFAPSEGYKQEVFLGLLEYLNAKIGKENILVQPEENKLVVYLSGRTVYGFEDPKIRSDFRIIFNNMSRYLEQLNVEHIYLTGHSRYKTVFGKNSQKKSGTSFILEQSMQIQDYFINEHGWSPKKFSVSSFGASRALKNNSKAKRFEMIIQMKKPEKPNRHLASVDSDKDLSSLAEETMQYIGEPKYSNIKVTKTGVEFNIARDYFWQTGTNELSEGGKQKLARIMKVMSKAEDLVYQFYWVPGRTETNEAKTRRRAFAQLDALRSYLVKDLDMPAPILEVGYRSRLNSLRMPASERDDTYNQRLIIKAVPLSVSNRPFK